VATHSNGCAAESLKPFVISVINSPKAGLLIYGDNPHPLGGVVRFQNRSVGGNEFSWSFGDAAPHYTLTEPADVDHDYKEVGNYCVRLIAKNLETLCQDTIKQCLDVVCFSEVKLPNIFTPNNDLVNDVFKFESKCIKFLSCVIYDRWENTTYRWTEESGGWDGKNLQGRESADGTYSYVLKYIDGSGKTVTRNGYVMLMR
jgi:gliding motility-associated-like protein